MAISRSSSAGTAEPTRMPTWPSVDELDLDRVRLDYYAEIDSFYVFFYGESLPAVEILLDDGWTYASELLDEEDNPQGRVVGLMIEGFRERAVPLHQHWHELLEFVESAPAISKGDDGRRRAAIARLIADTMVMPPYDGTGRPPRETLTYAHFEIKVERDEHTGRLVATSINQEHYAAEGADIAEVFARLGEVIARDLEAAGVKG
jgi:hypothetical protein